MSLYNQTHFTNFRLEIPDAGLTKGFVFNITAASIPGLRIPGIELPAGTQGLARAMIPGSTMEFDPLVVRILVDENLDAWTELYQWMLITNNYLTHNSEAWTQGNVPEFITIHVLDNTKTKIILSVHYKRAWCGELGELEFNYTDEGNPPITCIATFPYQYIEVEKNGVIISTRKSIREAADSKTSSSDATKVGHGNNRGMHPMFANRS